LIEQESVDAIMLGGTDLALVFNPDNASFPLIDCAAIHVDRIVDRAIGHLSTDRSRR
jgi:aspartate racemase